MDSGNMAEIIIVNGIGIFLMVFLLLTRIENVEKRFAGDKIFDSMIWITIVGCGVEAATFFIDGKVFFGCRVLSYILNSFCFLGTGLLGFLWCLFVDFRIFNSVRRMRKKAKVLAIPFAIDVVLVLINLTGCGIIFTVSENNVYERGSLVFMTYLILFLYFIYSLFLVDTSKKGGLHLRFFPVYYFVIPCMLGTVIQGMVYGITIGWTSVAIAFIFVSIQTQSLNALVDPLSGLYNRIYMDCIISQFKQNMKYCIYGIMIDVNDFKRINDVYGHSKGDDAIRAIGMILTDSIPDNGLAIRYAGDEFIVFIRTDREEFVQKIMGQVEENVEKFNSLEEEPFRISLAMGYSRYEPSSGNVEQFLSAMDEKMYEAKTQHYQQGNVDRRRR